MAYLGNTPTTQNFVSGTDYFNGTGSQTAFTLSRTVNSINDIQAVVNNVVQQPNDAYTLSGTTITFTSAPSSGTNNVYVRYLSTTTQVITPSQNSVGTAQLAPLTTIPVVGGYTVTLPSATGTMALTSGLGVTEADQWRLNANITTTTSSTVFSTNWERSDTYGAGYVGTGMTESSGVFTFPSTGTWLIQAMGRPAVNGSQRYHLFYIQVTTNNSTYDVAAASTQFVSQVSSNFTVGNLYVFYIFNVTSTANCKVRFAQECEGTAGNWAGSTTENNTAVNFIRLGAST